MNIQAHEELKAKIWEIANRLRGPYRPPQYRLVMLPMVVLRRLDCVLEPTKDAVLKRRDELEAQQMPEAAMDRLLGKAADPQRKHPLYNTSPYTFARLLGDAENIAPNLVSYINLLIRDTPPVGMYVLNMFRMRGSRLWGSRLHRACVV